MENSSLETVVLRLKSLKIDNVLTFPYLSKPSEEGLINSLEILKIIGALDWKEEKITKIGELLIKIPIEPFLSRAIVEGMIFERILDSPHYSKFYSHFAP
jgi:ATP-dependent helicase HrpA